MINQFNCLDCNIDPDEGYMLLDDLWLLINPNKKGVLCLPCAEKRLGRKFINSDFKITPEEMARRFKEYRRLREREI